MQNATDTRTRLIRVSFLVFAMIAASAIATYATDRYILHTTVRLGSSSSRIMAFVTPNRRGTTTTRTVQVRDWKPSQQ